MEFLPGISLAKLIEIEKHLPCHRAIHLLLQFCASLKEAHSLGLIHRDIKPLNIMVCRIGGEYDVVKVVDFGLVKSIKNLLPSETLDLLPNALRGTPAYIAPELLAQPLAANARSDIYSVGVLAYKMFSGRNLFEVSSEAGLLYDILYTNPCDLAQLRPDLPDSLVKLVMRCIHKNPQIRPAGMDVLGLELAAVEHRPAWCQADAKQWWGLRDELLLPAE